MSLTKSKEKQKRFFSVWKYTLDRNVISVTLHCLCKKKTLGFATCSKTRIILIIFVMAFDIIFQMDDCQFATNVTNYRAQLDMMNYQLKFSDKKEWYFLSSIYRAYLSYLRINPEHSESFLATISLVAGWLWHS